jgi:type IV pilus assembly protein PilC
MKMKKNKLGEMLQKVSKGMSSSHLSVKDQTFFIKRLSFLIKAGIPVIESLHMIREQTAAKRYAKILDTIIEDVSNGQFLSTSLAKFRGMFGEFAVNIVHVGETSGILSQNLEYLADELKKKQQLRQKVIGAFIYPAVVTFATLGITSFLMVYLFPKIIPVFSSLHMTLPISTRIVIFISNSLINYGWYIISFIIIFVAAFWVTLKKSKSFHYYFDKYVLKVPILGKIIQGYNLANTTRTMGLLLKSSITISEALPIVSKTTSNLVYKKEFQSMVSVINKGERISAYLKKKKNLFPEVLSQIIAVGERSGNLSNSFIYLSDLYEGEVDDFTKNLSSMIEPVLMIFMGILVGFIAISIITPIYSITQNLHG